MLNRPGVPSAKTPRPARSVFVENYWRCPTKNCELNFEHWNTDFGYIPPRPLRVPALGIDRFPDQDDPFPRRNVWRIIRQPPFILDTGNNVYLPAYGSLRLRMRDQSGVPGWRLFDGVDEDGVPVVVLAAPKKWARKIRTPRHS